MVSLLKLALRNVLRHKGRTALTLASIVFGVVAVILSGGFIEDTIVGEGVEPNREARLGSYETLAAGRQ